MAARSSKSGPPTRRRWRLIRRSCLLVLLLLVLALVFVTQSGVLRHAVLPVIARMTGCETTSSHVILRADGTLVLRDLRLSIADLDNPARQVLHAPLCRIGLDPISLLTGGVLVTDMTLERPTVRLSQGQDMSVNIAPLLVGTPSGSLPGRLPEIHVVDGALELGEHGDTWYSPLATLRVRGGLYAQHGAPGQYRIDLVEFDPDRLLTTASTTRLTGLVDVDAKEASIRLANVDLSTWSQHSAPTPYRALWGQLAVRGVVTSATFTYSADGMGADFELAEGGVNIPVPVTFDDAADSDGRVREGLLPMRDVRGVIGFRPSGVTAELAGRAKDLRCTVDFRTDGLQLDSPITCEITLPGYALEEQPELLPFAPSVARKIVSRFSGPTAEVSGGVRIERDVAGDWTYQGELFIDHGMARYEEFPYPIEDISAHFVFDEKEFTIARMTGRGPTGGRLTAEGFVSPPGTGAEVVVDVVVTDLPMDDVFRDAFPADRRPVYDVLFNEQAHRDLIEAGLILPAADAARLRARVREIDRILAVNSVDLGANVDALREERREIEEQLRIPTFELGGLATLNVYVHRPLGENTRYSTTIDMEIDQAGIVPKAFPYPVIADGVRLEIANDVVNILPTELRGVTGATGVISGEVAYAPDGGGYDPRIAIRARDVPVDAYLAQALPGDETDASALGGISARGLIEALGVVGKVDCNADVLSRPSGDIGFHAEVGLQGMASPPGESLPIRDIQGGLVVTEHRLAVENLSGTIADAPFTLSLEARLPDELDNRTGGLEGVIRTEGFDLRQPVEGLLEPLAPDAAARVAEARASAAPSGTIEAELSFAVRSSVLSYELSVAHCEDVAFDALGGRMAIDAWQGTAAITSDDVRFDDVRGMLRYESDPPVQVQLDGTMRIRDEVERADLSFGAKEMRFESALLRDVLGAAGRDAIATLEPRGFFDLNGTYQVGTDGTPRRSWSMSPRALSFLYRGAPVELGFVDGQVTSSPEGGRIENVTLGDDGWVATFDGVWSADPALRVQTTIDLEADGLPQSLRALLPDDLDTTLRGVELAISDTLTMHDAYLLFDAQQPDGMAAELLFDADIHFAGASFSPGVPISDANGMARVGFTRAPGALAGEIDVSFAVPRARLAGAQVSDVSAVLVSGSQPGTFVLPHFAAAMHGGRMTGRAIIDSTESGAGAYEVQTEMVGVDFGGLLADYRDPAEEETSAVHRGVLDASLRVAGQLEATDDPTRRGRGFVRIEGGDVLNMPGVMPILELSNLQPPAGEEVDLAFADFSVTGNRLLFEDLFLYSDTVRIEGLGTIGWPSLDLDLVMRSTGTRHIPIISELLENLRNELIVTRVSGTLYDPSFRYEQLSGTRRLVGTIFGGDEESRQTPDETRAQ
ncbi:MAG: hypothetical protein AAFX05_01685 [Planctomycetota bacterium]